MSLKLFGTNRDVLDLKNIDQTMIENIAKSLFFRYVIVVGEKEYRLAEIEFYIKSDNHNDQYTHGDQNQKQFGKWYFHRYPKSQNRN